MLDDLQPATPFENRDWDQDQPRFLTQPGQRNGNGVREEMLISVHEY